MQQKIGELYSKVVMEGNYGAYMVDNPKYPYYLVKFVGVPWEADGDGTPEVGKKHTNFTKEIPCVN